MQELKDQYDAKLNEKERLRKTSEETEMKLDRAAQLVEGLGGERERWEQVIP